MSKLTKNQKKQLRAKVDKMRNQSNIGYLDNISFDMPEDYIRAESKNMSRHLTFNPSVTLKVRFASYKSPDTHHDYIYKGVYKIDYSIYNHNRYIVAVSKFVGRQSESKMCINVKRVTVITPKAEYPIIPITTYNIDKDGNTVLSSKDNVESNITVVTTTSLPGNKKKKKH